MKDQAWVSKLVITKSVYYNQIVEKLGYCYQFNFKNCIKSDNQYQLFFKWISCEELVLNDGYNVNTKVIISFFTEEIDPNQQ
jgi:hypothetical protein